MYSKFFTNILLPVVKHGLAYMYPIYYFDSLDYFINHVIMGIYPVITWMHKAWETEGSIFHNALVFLIILFNKINNRLYILSIIFSVFHPQLINHITGSRLFFFDGITHLLAIVSVMPLIDKYNNVNYNCFL